MNPKSEAEWQAESDARTLMEAEEIKADNGRHTRAQDHAKKQAERLANLTAEFRRVEESAVSADPIRNMV